MLKYVLIVVIAFTGLTVPEPAAAQIIDRGTSNTAERYHVFMATEYAYPYRRRVWICVNDFQAIEIPGTSAGLITSLAILGTNARNRLTFHRTLAAPPPDSDCKADWTAVPRFINWAPVPFNGYDMAVDLRDDVHRLPNQPGHTVEGPIGDPVYFVASSYVSHNRVWVYSATGLFQYSGNGTDVITFAGVSATTVSAYLGGGDDCIDSIFSTPWSVAAVDCGDGIDGIRGYAGGMPASCESTYLCTPFPP